MVRFNRKQLVVGQEFRFRWMVDETKSTYLNNKGYLCFNNGVVEIQLHRFVWEKYYNAKLLPWAVIHHINGIKTDNRIENLQAMTRSEHGQIHHKKWKRIGLSIK